MCPYHTPHIWPNIVRIDRIQIIGAWLKERRCAMTVSRQDCQHAEHPSQQQQALRHKVMCSRVMPKIPHPMIPSCYIGSSSVCKYTRRPPFQFLRASCEVAVCSCSLVPPCILWLLLSLSLEWLLHVSQSIKSTHLLHVARFSLLRAAD